MLIICVLAIEVILDLVARAVAQELARAKHLEEVVAHLIVAHEKPRLASDRGGVQPVPVVVSSARRGEERALFLEIPQHASPLLSAHCGGHARLVKDHKRRLARTGDLFGGLGHEILDLPTVEAAAGEVLVEERHVGAVDDDVERTVVLQSACAMCASPPAQLRQHSRVHAAARCAPARSRASEHIREIPKVVWSSWFFGCPYLLKYKTIITRATHVAIVCAERK